MPKKKKDNVAEFPVKATLDELKLTDEEVAYVAAQDEADLDRYIQRFASTTILPDNSGIEEEDDEEEIITLDFDNGQAYEKVGEGVAVRDADGVISMIEDGPVFNAVKEAVLKEAHAPSPRDKYQDMITDRFVSKAIASLIVKINDGINSVAEGLAKTLPVGIREAAIDHAEKKLFDQKTELRKAIRNGQVYYEDIPAWANEYIDEYVQDALGALIDFVARD